MSEDEQDFEGKDYLKKQEEEKCNSASLAIFFGFLALGLAFLYTLGQSVFVYYFYLIAVVCAFGGGGRAVSAQSMKARYQGVTSIVCGVVSILILVGWLFLPK